MTRHSVQEGDGRGAKKGESADGGRHCRHLGNEGKEVKKRGHLDGSFG